jgi:hypothetical protein
MVVNVFIWQAGSKKQMADGDVIIATSAGQPTGIHAQIGVRFRVLYQQEQMTGAGRKLRELVFIPAPAVCVSTYAS